MSLRQDWIDIGRVDEAISSLAAVVLCSRECIRDLQTSISRRLTNLHLLHLFGDLHVCDEGTKIQPAQSGNSNRCRLRDLVE